MCSSLTITRWLLKIGYGLTWTLYIRPFLPSNLIWNCSCGRFASQRKHLRAAIVSAEVSAVDEMTRSGLYCTLQRRPQTSISLVSNDLRARKLEAASGHTESWSFMNF